MKTLILIALSLFSASVHAGTNLESQIKSAFIRDAKNQKTEIGKVFKDQIIEDLTPSWSLDPNEGLSIVELNSFSDEFLDEGDMLIIKRFSQPFPGGGRISSLVVRAKYWQTSKKTTIKLKVSKIAP